MNCAACGWATDREIRTPHGKIILCSECEDAIHDSTAKLEEKLSDADADNDDLRREVRDLKDQVFRLKERRKGTGKPERRRGEP